MNLMGEVQTQVLQRQIKDRFGLVVTFGPGSILYRETIASTVEGVGHFEPLRHYAEVHVLLEPLPAGSGVEVALDCPTDMLDVNWQRQIYGWLSGTEHIGVADGISGYRSAPYPGGRTGTPETYGGRRFPSGRAAGGAPGIDEGEKRAFGALAEFCAGSAAGVCRKGHDRYQPYGGGGGSAGNRGREGPAAGKGSGPPVWETTPRRLPDIREEREDFPWNWRAIFSAITPGKSSKPSDMTARGIPAIRPDPYSAVTVPGSGPLV